MGSRAVLVVCRDEETVRRRFGIVSEGIGICYTRTGRRFFEDAALETAFLATVKQALDRANTWEEFKTDWVSSGLRTDALVREGAGACSRTSTPPSEWPPASASAKP